MASASHSPDFPQSTKPNEHADLAGMQVFVVGSESAVLDYVRQALARDKLQLSSLTKEQALLSLQKGKTPDLILLHVVGEQALGTLTALRDARPTIPIIVFSCVPDSRFVVRVLQMGASDYIQLPFDIGGLQELSEAFSLPGWK